MIISIDSYPFSQSAIWTFRVQPSTLIWDAATTHTRLLQAIASISIIKSQEPSLTTLQILFEEVWLAGIDQSLHSYLGHALLFQCLLEMN